MAFQPVADCARATFVWEGGNNTTWTNSLCFTKPGFIPENMLVLATELADAMWEAGCFSMMSNAVTLRRIEVEDLREQGQPIRTATVARSGSFSGDMASPGLALVVTLRTALRGRSYRGRFYMSGWADEYIVNGEYQQAVGVAATEFFTLVDAAANPESWSLVVVSRQVDGVPREVGLGSLVTSVSVRSAKPGTQRRRINRP